MVENITIGNDTRKELENYAIGLLTGYLYDAIKKNLSQLQEKDRYYNWYHGFSEVVLPHPAEGYDVYCKVNSFATKGSIATQSFGDNKFDIEPNILYEFAIFPGSLENVTLHYDIEKVSMKGNFEDEFTLNDNYVMTNITNISNNVTIPNPVPWGGWWPAVKTKLSRKVLREDIESMHVKLVPGFNITWSYTGPGAYNTQEYGYKAWNYENTLSFVRYDACINKTYIIIYILLIFPQICKHFENDKL